MKEKQAVKCGGEGANTSAEHRNPSFNARDASFFLFFSKYLLSISRIVETRLDFRVFLESLRYGGKRRRERTKERRRKEEGRWKEAREEDEGNSEGRKESHTMARMKRKKEKG